MLKPSKMPKDHEDPKPSEATKPALQAATFRAHCVGYGELVSLRHYDEEGNIISELQVTPHNAGSVLLFVRTAIDVSLGRIPNCTVQ